MVKMCYFAAALLLASASVAHAQTAPAQTPLAPVAQDAADVAKPGERTEARKETHQEKRREDREEERMQARNEGYREAGHERMERQGRMERPATSEHSAR